MAKKLPKDGETRSAGSRAKAIVHYKFDADHWEYRDYTGVDIGIDCCMELTEGDEWTGNTIDCQVKGRSKPGFNSTNDYISIEISVSTINYALSRANPYLILLVDLSTETIYYLPVQEYFISNPALYSKLEGSQETITLRIPTDNIVSTIDDNLKAIAKNRYIGGPGPGLHRAV